MKLIEDFSLLSRCFSTGHAWVFQGENTLLDPDGQLQDGPELGVSYDKLAHCGKVDSKDLVEVNHIDECSDAVAQTKKRDCVKDKQRQDFPSALSDQELDDVMDRYSNQDHKECCANVRHASNDVYVCWSQIVISFSFILEG